MATILEGLNAISQAVGGAGEAESNLEALNQISEALGGSADATENAEAIANIAENASGGGGGGGGDITIAKVTMSAGRSAQFNSILVPLAQIIHENPETGAPNTMLVSVHTLTNGSVIPNAEVPLFRGKCIVSGLSAKPTTITGAAEYNAEQQMLTITGDCTLEW